MIVQRYNLENTSNGHNKFYCIILEIINNCYVLKIKWGAIGTNGQEQIKHNHLNISSSFNSNFIYNEVSKILNSKLSKGYKIISTQKNIRKSPEIKTYYEKDNRFWAILFDKENLEIKIKAGIIGNNNASNYSYSAQSISLGAKLLEDEIIKIIKNGYKPIW